MALLEKVDDHLTVADALAIELYPRVLALRPFARVRFINLLIGKSRQLEPSQCTPSGLVRQIGAIQEGRISGSS
jgi:hypothetical protein